MFYNNCQIEVFKRLETNFNLPPPRTLFQCTDQDKLDSVCVQHLQLNVITRTLGFISGNPLGVVLMTQPVKQMEAQTLLCVLHGAKSHIIGQQNFTSCPHSYIYCPVGSLLFWWNKCRTHLTFSADVSWVNVAFRQVHKWKCLLQKRNSTSY